MVYEYLSTILGLDQSIEVCSVTQFLESERPRSHPIFLIDQGDLVLPLQQYVQLLDCSYPNARYLLLNSELDTDHLSGTLESGIHGIVTYSDVKRDLIEAVRTVFNGRFWVNPRYVPALCSAKRHSGHVRGTGSHELLTKREADILHLVRHHFSNKEISLLLGIQESTVKFHLSNVLLKYRVSNRGDLIAVSRVQGAWKQLLLACKKSQNNPRLYSLFYLEAA